MRRGVERTLSFARFAEGGSPVYATVIALPITGRCLFLCFYDVTTQGLYQYAWFNFHQESFFGCFVSTLRGVIVSRRFLLASHRIGITHHIDKASRI